MCMGNAFLSMKPNIETIKKKKLNRLTIDTKKLNWVKKPTKTLHYKIQLTLIWEKIFTVQNGENT